MLQAVDHDLAAEAMAFDVEKPSGIGLIPASELEDTLDEHAFGIGEARDEFETRRRAADWYCERWRIRAVGDFAREVNDIDCAVGAKQKRALNRVAQLTDVAWPVVTKERILGRGRYVFDRLFIRGCDVVNEMPCER
jgi:hypothetical protein